MACTDDQPNFKHYCRVCKRGFMCGRALGGHMRAHGIGDERGNIDDDYPINDLEEKFGGGADRSSNRRMYQLRTNPNRLKTFRTCENCGKEFSSWKSFLEHGKCSSDDASESLVSSPDSDEYDDTDGAHCSSGWSKRKRSLRSKVGSFSATSYPPREEDDIMLARCLVQLANTVVNHIPIVGKNKGKEVVSGTSPKGMFQCKACNKVFNSHQALGGHRASHKKVKGCYAAKQDQISHREESNGVIAMEDDAIASNEEFLIPPSKSPSSPSSLQFEQGPPSDGTTRRKPKVHECSICHRVFSSGQALGGHKRCHWITSNSPLETSYLPKNNIDPVYKYHNSQHKPMIAISDKLDLNVPAWAHGSGLMLDPANPLSFNMSTNPWIGPDSKTNNTSSHCHSHGLRLKNGYGNNENGDIIESNNVNGSVDTKKGATRCIEDEADSKLIKLAKLSDLNGLKEMDNSGSSSSQWLQVGIGSTTEATTDV